MSADAHLAVATSMYRDGYPLHEITEATGVAAAELADALAPQGHVDPGPATGVAIDVPVTARPLLKSKTAPAPLVGFTGDQEELLTWGEAHESAAIKALAARTRSGLVDLAQRRGSERAAEQAAAEVEQLEKQLAAAKARLRQARTGRIPAPATPVAAPVAVPTPIRVETSAGLPREQLAQIRTWARPRVRGRRPGLIPAAALEAWNNRDQQLAQAG
ncbi:hypothetical protein GXW82_43825 [Streptacidiphilus sp. 4-A2]|nr:hypothetical protein [Streptacidiphilus sp. 4-A2]